MSSNSIIGSDSDHSSKKAFDNEVSIEKVMDQDELDLARMGYAQVRRVPVNLKFYRQRF